MRPMQSAERRRQADRFLYEMGLLDRLKCCGEPHIVGSYRMDMMAWNDLDIDIENSGMSMDKLYDLTAFVVETFRPVWYEAKQEVTDEGKTVWFHGFETAMPGELWNFDLWFFDAETIAGAERYCDGIAAKVAANPPYREAILSIKRGLIDSGLYGQAKYTSMDVYEAVTERGVLSPESFLHNRG